VTGVEFVPALAEEAILRASAALAPPVQAEFRRERDRLYEIGDPRQREAGFAAFTRTWMRRLGLARPLERVLAEHPVVAAGIGRCLTVPVGSDGVEGADLHDEGEARSGQAPRPALLFRIRATSLLAPERLVERLSRDMLHVQDMLDPAFAYRREWPEEFDPSLTRLMRERLGAAWGASVAGRLGGERDRGVLHAESRRRFLAAFQGLTPGSAEAAFKALFDGSRPTFPELQRLALHPAATCGEGPEVRACSLCRLPSPALRVVREARDGAQMRLIQRDFPAWDGDAGICPSCDGLYAARLGVLASAQPAGIP
jgi:hypothetical protein